MSKGKWITDQIQDLTGKVMIVTGGNSGLGFESVKAFASKGAEVILATRTLQRGNAAKTKIGPTPGKIQVMHLDLMDFKSIRRFADRFKAKYKRLDVLMNNAGIMMTHYFQTKDGLEAQNGVNHFGHFALTGQLLELIISTPGSRVVNVSSSGHKYGEMDFENLLFENGNGYTPIKSYGRSKLSNLLFTYELQRKFDEYGIDSIAVAAHPGASRTNLDRFINNKLWFKLLWPLFRLISQDQVRGSLSQIRASVDPEVKGGEYYGPHRNMTGDPVLVQSNKASHSLEDARKLWEVSEELTGVTFDFRIQKPSLV